MGDPRRTGLGLVAAFALAAGLLFAILAGSLPGRITLLLFLMAIAACTSLALFVPRWNVEVDRASGAVEVYARRWWLPATRVAEHAAPAWGVAVERQPTRLWDQVPAVRFPDGARIPVSTELAAQVESLAEETAGRTHIETPVDLVLGREAASLQLVLVAAAGAAVAALAMFVYELVWPVAIGPAPAPFVPLVAFGILAVIATGAAIGRHVRPRLRLTAEGNVEIQNLRAGHPAGRPRWLPFLKAVTDLDRRLIDAGPGLRVGFAPFPGGRDILAEIGASAIEAAATELRSRLAPALAGLDVAEIGASYRDAPDPRRAVARLRMAVPLEVAWLRRAPEPVFRSLCEGLPASQVDVLKVFRAEA